MCVAPTKKILFSSWVSVNIETPPEYLVQSISKKIMQHASMEHYTKVVA